METTTKSAPAGGKYVLTTGGLTEYCTLGQHFTTGRVWKYWVGIVATGCVCDDCAQKEAA